MVALDWLGLSMSLRLLSNTRVSACNHSHSSRHHPQRPSYLIRLQLSVLQDGSLVAWSTIVANQRVSLTRGLQKTYTKQNVLCSLHASRVCTQAASQLSVDAKLQVYTPNHIDSVAIYPSCSRQESTSFAAVCKNLSSEIPALPSQTSLHLTCAKSVQCFAKSFANCFGLIVLSVCASASSACAAFSALAGRVSPSKTLAKSASCNTTCILCPGIANLQT
jgi:hypothetical protein